MKRFAYAVLLPIVFATLVTFASAQFGQDGSKRVGFGAAGSFVEQGHSVSLSGDGNRAIVGGPFDNQGFAGSPGAAWVYARDGYGWYQQGSKLVGYGAVGNAGQGQSVCISADGSTAIVGGPYDNGMGAAWVYTYTNGWGQQAKLVGNDGGCAQFQGWSVSLSSDGNTAIVGGYYDYCGVGAAWVFTRTGGVWTQQGSKLVGTGAAGNAQQGYSVSLSSDGNTAIVGGQYDNSNIGAAWVYTRSGGVWTQQGSKLVGTGAPGIANQGTSVSLSSDGNTAMVGGNRDDSDVGAVWVFTRTAGVWSQQGGKLVGTGAVGTPVAQGSSVSLSADGNKAIVGGYNDDSNVGAAWVFTRTGGVWTQEGTKLVGTGAVGIAQQGSSVSISADARTAIVGGQYDNSGLGAVWMYSVPMSYVSSAVTQNTTNVIPNTTNQQILGIQVVTTGFVSPINITSLDVNTNGTTSTADISNLKIFYTGITSTFAATTQFGSTIAAPNGAHTVTGTQTLYGGSTNYFWLTYDINPGATLGHNVDAECNSITGSGSMGVQTPSSQAPAGSRTIVSVLAAGDYTVGTTLFNKLTGRNITVEKQTRRVMREVPVDESLSVKNNGTRTGDRTFHSLTPKELRFTKEEVEEDYGVLMENGKPYHGDLFIPLTTQDNSRLGLTNNPQGIYLTLTAALTDLNIRGVSGPVRFLLTDASYSESYPLVVDQFAGASATNTVTLKPNTGVVATISGSSSTSVLKLNGADYFIVDGSNTVGGTTRDLTISNTNTNSGTAAIWLASLGTGAGATNDAIRNCNLATGETYYDSFGIFAGGPYIYNSATGNDNDNCTIENCSITKSYIGIYASASSSGHNSGWNILSNSIGSSTVSEQIGWAGIVLREFTGSVIQNSIFNILTTSYGPIGMLISSGVADAVIRGNDIHSIRFTSTFGSGGTGIDINTGSSTSGTGAFVVSNNMISDIGGDGGNSLEFNAIVGIRISGTTGGIKLYNNSVNLGSGSFAGSTFGTISAALYLGSSTSNLTILNNILATNLVNTNAPSALTYACYSATTSNSVFTDINYNDYYPAGSQSVLGSLNSIDRTTLGAWMTATGKDVGSTSGNPGFLSVTNSHINTADANSWNVNGRGVAIASVATDIDGNARSITLGTPTDIGADEFATPSVDPPAATMTGTIANGQTTTFTTSGKTVGQITWHGTGAPSSPMSLPSSVTFKYFPGKLPPPFIAGQPNFINSYWEITTPDGSGFTYDLTLNYTVAEINAIPELDLGVAKRNGSNPWVHQSGAVVNNTAKTVFIGGLTSFSQFTLDDNNSPLPIQLASFTATEVPNHGVQLRWTTLSETNNYGFYVQRRRQNETAWTELPNSFIAGNGTTNEPHNYTFRDSSASSGSWSYRLKQVDLDNTIHFTEAVQVNVLTSVKEVAPIAFLLQQNYPNPFNPETNIKFSVETTDRATLAVYNLLGQKVGVLFDDIAQAGQYYKVRFSAIGGSASGGDGRTLASGIYIFKLESGTKKQMRKMLLLK